MQSTIHVVGADCICRITFNMSLCEPILPQRVTHVSPNHLVIEFSHDSAGKMTCAQGEFRSA